MEYNENPRKTAVKLLGRIEQGGAYSNILLDEHFRHCRLDAQGRKFCAALFYGTLERRLTLDEIIKKYSDKPAEKLGGNVRNILRTALYQLLYMDSVPESAAVNEAVKLASGERNPAVKGYVNGLLRAFIRGGKQIPEPNGLAEKLSVVYSCPLPLVKKWLSEYGEKDTISLLSASIGRPPVTLRTNTVRIGPQKLADKLRAEGSGAAVNEYLPECIDFSGASPESSKAYAEGLFHVQDIASMCCAEELEAAAGMYVLDVCAAPGGKSFTIAEIMQNSGVVRSFDLHKNRVRLISGGAERLGLDIIDAAENDAKSFNEELCGADRVLCDVPCSGFGVIRRKPEIKYKPLEEFERLPQIQYEILDISSKYVKSGGLLVYSTCTISKAENERNAERFLAEHDEFEPAPLTGRLLRERGSHMVTLFPASFGSDGFFIAKFRRKV